MLRQNRTKKQKVNKQKEINFSKVKKWNVTYKILHFPKQSLTNSQFDWSQAGAPLIECHMAFKSLA